MEQEVREGVCRIALDVLARRTGSLEGCRKLLELLSGTELFDTMDPLYVDLSAVASDTDIYPATEAERELWNQRALEKHEASGEEILRDVAETVDKVCRELLERFRH